MKKRVFSIIMVVLLALVMVACKKTDGGGDGDDKPTDTIAPLLEVTPAEVNIEYNQDYDLMTGVTARDNVDGTITSEVKITDDQGFDNKTPGTYVITYSVTDKAGNTSTKKRTITVAEMRTTIEINGEQYPMNYNPQLNEYNDQSFPFDLTKVTVLEAEYAEWLAENNTQRFGAYWSVVAVLDADRKVVEYRDFNTNQVDATGSKVAEHWSTGTGTGKNDAYVNRFGMLANLEIPEGGYVVVFINDGANGAGSPRAFGAKHIVEKAFDALGTEVKFHNVPEGAEFDPDKTYPIIKLAEEKLDSRLLPVVKIDQGTKAIEAFGDDLLTGVTVFHERETLTPTIKRIFVMKDGETTEINKDEIDENDLTAVYGIQYEVTDAAGNVATETRYFSYLKVITEPVDEWVIQIGENQFPLAFNFGFKDQIGLEPTVFRLDKPHLESLEEFSTATDDGKSLGMNYRIQYGIIAITDKDGKVLEIRMHNDGSTLTWDAEQGKIVKTDWVISPTQMQLGLIDAIPAEGYAFVFQHTNYGENSPRTFGYRNLINTQSDTGGGFSAVEYMDVNPFAEDFRIVVKNLKDEGEPGVEYLTFGNLASTEFVKGYDFSKNIGLTHDVYQFTYEQWQEISAIVDAEDYVKTGNYRMANISLAITDKDGNVVAIRLYQQWTADQSGIQLTKENGAMKVQMTGLPFDRNNIEIGVMNLLPEGGFVYVFASPTPGNDEGYSAAMKFGYKYLLGLKPSLTQTATLFDARFVDFANAPINPFAEGYKILVTNKFVEPGVVASKSAIKIGEAEYALELDKWEWKTGGGLGLLTSGVAGFTKEYLSTLPEYTNGPVATAPEGMNYDIAYAIAAITDKDGKVLEIRIHPGHKLTWDAENNEIKLETGLDTTKLQVGIYDAIPEDGFLFVFQNTGLPGNAIRAWGTEQLTGYADVGGTGYGGAVTPENPRGGVEGMTVNPFAEGFKIEIINLVF